MIADADGGPMARTRQARPRGPDPVSMFFLSYAHDDDGRGGYVRDFLDDLRDEMHRMTGRAQEDLGFIDVEIRTGDQWDAVIAREIAECRVLLALCSPLYFGSEFCGKEWQAFADRLAAEPPVDNRPPPLIVPLRWEAMAWDTMPAAARAVQHAKFGHADYDSLGLRQMVKRKLAYGLAYDLLLKEIVGKIEEAVAQFPLRRAGVRPAFDTVANAFKPTPAGGPASAQPAPVAGAIPAPADAARSGGPKHVHLVLAAPTAGDQADRPLAAPYYGPRPEDWTPFHPDERAPLIRRALAVVVEKDMTPYPERLDGQILARLDKAKQDNELVVLLIDPWAALEPHHASLTAYDGRLDRHSGAVLIWNPADPANAGQPDRPDTVRSRFFPTKNAYQLATLPAAARSAAAFGDTLLLLLARLQTMLFDAPIEPPRPAGTAGPTSQPRIAGPGASS